MSTKNIWIISEYAGSPEYGLNFRHYHLAQEFIRLGHRVTVLAGSYSHLRRKNPEPRGACTREEIDGITYLWLKVPKYARSHSLKRGLKWLVFAWRLLRLPELPRPDVVILSPTATFAVPPARWLARRQGARFILEIRDIWPLTIVELGGVSPRHPLVVLMARLERYGIRHCDQLVSNLPGYGNYLRQQGIERSFEYIPNGIHLNGTARPEPLDPATASLLPRQGFIVGYAGTVGVANALGYLVRAAAELDDPEIKIVIVGNGQEREALMREAAGLQNVLFLPVVPKRQVQALLSRFDACYIGWHRRGVYDYGIAADKLSDYMYAARPVLHSYSGDNDPVEMAGCGVTVPAEDEQAVIRGIKYLRSLTPEQRTAMGAKGRQYVEQHHLYETLAERYTALF